MLAAPRPEDPYRSVSYDFMHTKAMLLLLQQLWLLLHHRPLLGTRSDNATRQNESRRRERQDVLLRC
jgi:hypothetical protein